MRNPTRRSIRRAERRDTYGEHEASGVGELKAVAEQLMETGARYLERGREFFNPRSDDMARHDDWNDNDRDPRARGNTNERQGRGRGGMGGIGADPWGYEEQGSPRREGSRLRDHLADTYAPDDHSRSNAGGGHGHGGHDYDDRNARDYDARAEQLQRQRHDSRGFEASRDDDWRAGYLPDRGYEQSGQHQRSAHHREEMGRMGGGTNYGGELRGDVSSLPGGRHRYRSGQSAYGTGFEDAALRGERHRGESAATREDYRGRGPRGYTRSDQRILEDVNERLSDDALLDASDIDVRCENGCIVLEGEVDSRWMKHRAEDIADSVSGAKEVDNRIRVRRAPGHPQRSDTRRGEQRRESGSASDGTRNAGDATDEKQTPQQPH